MSKIRRGWTKPECRTNDEERMMKNREIVEGDDRMRRSPFGPVSASELRPALVMQASCLHGTSRSPRRLTCGEMAAPQRKPFIENIIRISTRYGPRRGDLDGSSTFDIHTGGTPNE